MEFSWIFKKCDFTALLGNISFYLPHKGAPQVTYPMSTFGLARGQLGAQPLFNLAHFLNSTGAVRIECVQQC